MICVYQFCSTKLEADIQHFHIGSLKGRIVSLVLQEFLYSRSRTTITEIAQNFSAIKVKNVRLAFKWQLAKKHLQLLQKMRVVFCQNKSSIRSGGPKHNVTVHMNYVQQGWSNLKKNICYTLHPLWQVSSIIQNMSQRNQGV